MTSPENPSLDATVYDDLAPLVPRQGDGQPSPERLMEAAWNTSALAHEPEFAGVALSPFEASTLFAKTGQEYEEEHGSPEAMAEDEREEAYLEILSKTVQKLLTPEIRGQLVAGLTALRQRLRTRRQWERLATAAAAQMILEGDKTGAMSAAVGLAHELVRRSVNTGFELAESLAQLPAGADDDAPLSSEDLDEWIYRTGAGEKLAALLESDPTLQRYVERQVDQTWEEGVAALFGGDLQLEFYTPEEIVPAALIAEQVLEMEESGDGEQETTGQSQMEILYAQMTDYVQQLFTQERIDQLVHQLDGIMHEQAAELGRWSSFLTLLRDTLAAEGGVADAQGALVAALLYDVFAIPADEEEEEERTMTMLPARVLYYGKDEPLPERIPLRAGPLSLVYEGGDLRYIKLGETEILRRVYVAIRDRNWDTILPQISNLQLEVGEDEFRISYDVANVQGEIDFRWHGEISGDRNGQIRFAMDGEAHSTFIRNRIGFCVLHPMTVAGAPARIDRVDGMAQESAFPRRIAPQLVLDGVIKPMQPFDEMQALSHEITPGVWATVHFTGDIFETEDQRNWTDASFKTYSTPLRLPFPVEIQQGTKITQSVTLTLQDSSATAAQPQSTADEEETLTFRIVQPETRTPLPALGLGLASHGEPLGEEELTRLRALHLDHLRVDLTPSSPAFEETLHRAATEAQAADLSLQAALHLSDAAQAELNRLNALLARLQPPVSAWLVFDTQTKTTPAALVDLARRQLSSYQPNTPIGGGVDGYFTE
ncbi:MAG TPA: hypothetical protein PKE45_02680, partial [Caldilineaceae bacterium]|nr:hypothetical protein [Caldilineaceae bacterium]